MNVFQHLNVKTGQAALEILGRQLQVEEEKKKLMARIRVQGFRKARKAGDIEATIVMMVKPVVIQVKSQAGEDLARAYFTALKALKSFGLDVPLENRPKSDLWKWPATIFAGTPKEGVTIKEAMEAELSYKARLESPEEVLQNQTVFDVIDILYPQSGQPDNRLWEMDDRMAMVHKWDQLFAITLNFHRGADGAVVMLWEAHQPCLVNKEGIVQRPKLVAKGQELPPMRGINAMQLSSAALKVVRVRQEDGVDAQNLLIWSCALTRLFQGRGEGRSWRDSSPRYVMKHLERWVGERMTGIPWIDSVLIAFKKAAAVAFASNPDNSAPWVETAIRDACGIAGASDRFQGKLGIREIQELHASILENAENLCFWPLLAYYGHPELPAVPASVNNWILAAAGENPWSIDRKLGNRARLQPTNVSLYADAEEDIRSVTALVQPAQSVEEVLAEAEIPNNPLMAQEPEVSVAALAFKPEAPKSEEDEEELLTYEEPEALEGDSDPYAGLSDEDLEAMTAPQDPDAQDPGLEEIQEQVIASGMSHVDMTVSSLVIELNTGTEPVEVAEELADVPVDDRKV